jgi:hypothetical protein
MAYGLPPPWDSGYALPGNVLDEGLQRRAFVTKQMPRGTYYQSSVGDGGYAVPQYVLDEGYGQGAFVTKWAPSGSYPGKRIPHWLNARPQTVADRSLPDGGQKITIQRGMGGIQSEPAMPNPIATYGQRAATQLMNRMATLPPAHRKTVLKATLDQVDPKLWTRTAQLANKYHGQGMPAAQALHQGLAHAMSAGIARELVDTGLRRQPPQPRSLLGLGCYGCAVALGAVHLQADGGGGGGGVSLPAGGGLSLPPRPAPAPTPAPVPIAPPVATTPGPAPTPSQASDPSTWTCPAPAGFKWAQTLAADGSVLVPGHWERLSKGETQGFAPCGPGGTGAPPVVVVRDHTPEEYWLGPFGFTPDKFTRNWGIGQPSATTANRVAPPDLMVVNPNWMAAFAQPPAGSPLIRMTQDILTWLHNRLTEVKDANGQTDNPVHYTDKSEMYGFPEPDAAAWFKAMGIDPTTPLRMHTLQGLRTTSRPFIKTKDPKTGKDMVMHLMLRQADMGQPWDAKTNPLVLKIWLSGVPDPSFFQQIWNIINFVPMAIAVPLGEVVTVGAEALADLACDLLNNPAAAAAASAGAVAMGAPPQAGAAGVGIAKQACGGPPPPPPPPPAPSLLLPLAIAGGVVAAALLLTRKTKAKR